MQKAELESIIQRLKQGDSHAMTDMYNITRHAVFASIISILRDYHLTEDAMQNTYLKIHSAVSGYNDMSTPLAWIVAIARNEALMLLRKRKHETSIDDSQTQIGNPDSQYVNVENKIFLNALLKCLNANEREIVLMHDCVGLKHREIAQILAKPLGSVLWSYNNAFKKLRKHINHGGDYQ